MKKTLLFLSLFSSVSLAQPPRIFLQEYWSVSGHGMAFNIEAFDINKDGVKDIIVGNWNDTYVYFGGAKLDSTPDLVYTGRLLAICDYNGDGHKDMVTMHLTSFDSSRMDYNGEMLFYYGSDASKLAIDTVPTYSIPLPTKYPVRDEFSLGYALPGVECGDFNGDGKADIVINSLDALPDLVGVVYVYMGNNIPPDTATYTIRGRSIVPGKPPIFQYGAYFQVGDINHDGYDDLLLSYEIQKVPPYASGGNDSLDVLDVYLGGKNFAFLENAPSQRFQSRLRDSDHSLGWFKMEFSMADINGDDIPDLIVAQGTQDGTDHVHFGSKAGIDTIPSYYIRDPDTTRADVLVGNPAFDIGDFNNDGYDDIILAGAGYNSFTLNLGGPHFSNQNPYALRGLLEAVDFFPTKAIACGDQNGDGVTEFLTASNSYDTTNIGYVLMFLGDPTVQTGVKVKGGEKPRSFELLQNYPNPFNPSTMISYQLAVNNFVKLKVFDLLGREVATLVNKEILAGKHEVEFDAGKYELGSGLYIYELSTKTQRLSRKMLYVK